MTNPEELPEFDVEIRVISHGYVRVRAKNQAVAKNGVEKTNREQLMKHYKEKFRFHSIGEATLVEKDDNGTE